MAKISDVFMDAERNIIDKWWQEKESRKKWSKEYDIKGVVIET